MSGYRQHSYDPNAGYEEPVPLKPYDKWQRLGVCSVGAGALLLVISLMFDGARDWPRLAIVDWSSGAVFLLCIGGLLLMKYRREPTADDPQPAASERRRRLNALIWIAIGTAAVAYNILASQGVF